MLFTNKDYLSLIWLLLREGLQPSFVLRSQPRALHLLHSLHENFLHCCFARSYFLSRFYQPWGGAKTFVNSHFLLSFASLKPNVLHDGINKSQVFQANLWWNSFRHRNSKNKSQLDFIFNWKCFRYFSRNNTFFAFQRYVLIRNRENMWIFN